MAAGRPVVGSPVGANSSIIVAGKTGFLADGMEEWISTLSGLAADRERNQKMGLAARERAEAMYSLQCHAAKLVEVLKFALLDRDTELERASIVREPKSRAEATLSSYLGNSTPAE
jgi:glycosyltransferase involved in cell wall biosynthesis